MKITSSNFVFPICGVESFPNTWLPSLFMKQSQFLNCFIMFWCSTSVLGVATTFLLNASVAALNRAIPSSHSSHISHQYLHLQKPFVPVSHFMILLCCSSLNLSPDCPDSTEWKLPLFPFVKIRNLPGIPSR